MALSEIEKLERRYAENPQGLTFAPLAEVHRKNGDVARALELLRPGLELHPDYIPASIVMGRCQLDLGRDAEAEAAFTHVLALDGENVIALKSLADLSERLHHFVQAERWLNTLLSVDRSNDEARAQLERIDVARRDAAAAPVPPEIAAVTEPAAVADTGEAPADVAGAPAVESPPPPVAEPAPAWMAKPEAPDTEEAVPLALEDLEPTLTADDVIEPPPPGLEVEEPEILAPSVEPIAGLVGRDVDEEALEGSEFRVELSEDIVLSSSGGGEFQVPDAAHELSARVPPPPTSPFGEEPAPGFGALEEPPMAPPPPLPPEPVAVPAESTLVLPGLAPPEPPPGSEPAPRAAEPVADLVASPEPELVVTETMAEVLLQQGHSVEALRVYRELEVRNAGDARLLRKIAELEAANRPAPPEPAPTEPVPARRQYTAAETGGQSVGDFLRALLAARPAAAAAAARAPATPPVPPERSGAPTRPAAEALSLSSVFGEESSPLPPAVPASPAPAPGVSFDEFYSPPSSGGTSPKTRAPDPKSDDLDQFHAWLQNLKR
jgi:tetratricopeptide (TPR) repeat protein